MSIPLVTTLPAPTPSSSTGNEAAGGQDFAKLLNRKMAVSNPIDQASSPLPANVPVADAVPADAASLLAALGLAASPADATPADATPADTTPADAMPGEVPADAASVLAALGLVTTPAGALPPTAGPSGKTSTDPLSAVSTGQGRRADATSELLIAQSLNAEPTLSASAASDELAAKFAVTSAISGDAMATKAAALDASASAIVPLAGSVPGNAPNLPVQRDSPLSLPTSVRDQNWSADFGQKVVWLATHDKQSAQLTLNPPQMGPIEIALNIDKGNASVSFVSANAEVRDAIETALPRLREMFASAGIELGQTNVSSESFKQHAGSGEQSSSRSMADNAILAGNLAGSLQVRAFSAQQGNGLVNIFA